MTLNEDWSIPGASNSTPEPKLASFQHRLGAISIDLAFAFLTLGLGWFIWSLVVWGKGQTPGKQIVKIRVYGSEKRTPASWGHMAVRELLMPFAIGFGLSVLNLLTAGIVGTLGVIAWYVLEIVWYFTKGQRTLRDYWVKTLVVNEA